MIAHFCEYLKTPVQLELGIVCDLVFFALLGVVVLFFKAEKWKV